MEGVLRPSLWFVVPAHGRFELAEVCLRQLARSCAAITAGGVDCTAVVVADDENLEVARAVGFWAVERDNLQLGRKWNDGYELAGREGAGFVAPFGTDDWIDPAFVLSGDLPEHGQVRCARLSAVVREDAARMAELRIPYDGGDGVRIWPTSMLEPLGFRPAEEDRDRAIDTSVLREVTIAMGRPPAFVYHDLHPLQIVDFKSEGEQLNTYRDCLRYVVGEERRDVWHALAGHFPAEALSEMSAVLREPVAA